MADIAERTSRTQCSSNDTRVVTVLQFRAVPACIGVLCRPPRLSSDRKILRANPSGVHRYNVRPTTRASSRLSLLRARSTAAATDATPFGEGASRRNTAWRSL